MEEKVKAPIVGADGNIFNLIGISSRALKREGFYKEADELTTRVMESKSYDEALNIIMEYVEPVEVDYERNISIFKRMSLI